MYNLEVVWRLSTKMFPWRITYEIEQKLGILLFQIIFRLITLKLCNIRKCWKILVLVHFPKLTKWPNIRVIFGISSWSDWELFSTSSNYNKITTMLTNLFVPISLHFATMHLVLLQKYFLYCNKLPNCPQIH